MSRRWATPPVAGRQKGGSQVGHKFYGNQYSAGIGTTRGTRTGGRAAQPKSIVSVVGWRQPKYAKLKGIGKLLNLLAPTLFLPRRVDAVGILNRHSARIQTRIDRTKYRKNTHSTGRLLHAIEPRIFKLKNK